MYFIKLPPSPNIPQVTSNFLVRLGGWSSFNKVHRTVKPIKPYRQDSRILLQVPLH